MASKHPPASSPPPSSSLSMPRIIAAPLDAPSLTPPTIAAINDYFLVDTLRAKCDIGFIFGTQDRAICDRLAAQAARAYHDGYFPKLVISGGPLLRDVNISEADYIAALLHKKGVPPAAMIIENASCNTQQNIEFAQEILARIHTETGQNPVPNQTAYCFGNAYGGRRFLMTLKRRWPELTPVFESVVADCDSDCGDFKNQWHTTSANARRLTSEFNKIAPYTAQDWLREVDIEALNRAIMILPQPTNTNNNKTQHGHLRPKPPRP